MSDINKVHADEIFLLESYVQGMYENPKRNKLIKKIRIGDNLNLTREKDNQINHLAIRIDREDGKKLGYLSMDSGDVIARLMDAGKTIAARVSQIDRPDLSFEVFNNEHVVRTDIFLVD